MLHSPSLALRLSALRAFAQAGEAGARALLMGPGFQRPDESYPWVWALSRCVHPDLFQILRLSGHPAHDLLSRVRFLMRRAQREHTWPRRLSRAACVDSMWEALHPLQTLACAVRLLEMHGERAIPALLELVRWRPQRHELGLLERLDEKAECAAWALGRLGRVAVPEIVQEYRDASARVRRHLAMALWYVGPEAGKALPYLLQDDSSHASAALLAMEGRASQAQIEHRRGPLWLDEEAVRSLASIAFSDQEREYAAAALGCFGPAAQKALPILLHLSRDPEREVRLQLARGLAWGGRQDAFLVLLSLTRDKDEEVSNEAARALHALHASPEEARTRLYHHFLTGSGEERRRAAGQLARYGVPPGSEQQIDLLLRSLEEPELSVAVCCWQ